MTCAAPEDGFGAPPSLDLLREPAVLLSRGGGIVAANAPARALLGDIPASGPIFDWVLSPRAEFDAFLRRSSGSTGPIVGAVELGADGGPVRYRIDCERLRGAGPARLLLRLHPPQNNPFGLLDRRVQALNAQLRRRTQENLELQEALRENRVLLAELQHRVKNNIQVMMSLMTLSGAGSSAPEAIRIVENARLRLQALSSAQEALYRSEGAGTISAAALLGDVVAGIGSTLGLQHRLDVGLDDAMLTGEEAHALALIASELTTNALRHGLRGGSGAVAVRFHAGEEGCALVVQDSGTGIAPGAERCGSGFRIVRRLCQELRGSFDTAYDGGARCTLSFEPRSSLHRQRTH